LPVRNYLVGGFEQTIVGVSGLEQLLGLFVAGVILAAAARRVAAPYPVFLAIGGAVLASFRVRRR